MRSIVPLLALVVALTIAASVPAEGDAPHSERVRRGEPITVYVVVALCDNAQIACGSGGLGSPGNLKSNLYWGALFGAKRILDRADSGWTAVPQTTAVEGVLERAVYRRRVDGARWGRSEPVEQLLVLDAIHGAEINRAVTTFFLAAAHGAELVIDDGERRRELAIDLAGYAGHNRMMDGLRLPAVSADGRAPVPSFVLACLSDRFFSEPLRDAGSEPLVMTRSFMAPEGYVVEATARAFGDNLSPEATRQAVIAAYARWQKISDRVAATVFVR
jgi:hypothetical protein